MSANETTNPLRRFSGAVLVGGRSTRMGSDKASLISPDGESLLAHAVRVLRAAGAAEVMVSVRAGQRYGIPDTREVNDATDDCGPLGGLTAVLAAAQETLVLVLAVDLAAVSTQVLAALLALANAECGAVFEDAEGLQPLAAVYPKSAALAAQRALDARRLSLRAFVEELERAGLMRRVRIDGAASTALRNFNTPEEWRAWRATWPGASAPVDRAPESGTRKR